MTIISLVSLTRGDALNTFDHFPIHADKVFHFFAYCVLGATLCWAFPIEEPNAYGVLTLIVVTCAFYGLILEGLQALIETINRDFSFGDAVANTAGSIAGATAWRRYVGMST